MSTMVDLLSRTRSLVARGWTQRADARDEDGKSMMYFEEAGVLVPVGRSPFGDAGCAK